MRRFKSEGKGKLQRRPQAPVHYVGATGAGLVFACYLDALRANTERYQELVTITGAGAWYRLSVQERRKKEREVGYVQVKRSTSNRQGHLQDVPGANHQRGLASAWGGMGRMKQNLWLVQAQVKRCGIGNGHVVIQVPTFILDGDIQGIRGDLDARRVALEMLQLVAGGLAEVSLTTARLHFAGEDGGKKP